MSVTPTDGRSSPFTHPTPRSDVVDRPQFTVSKMSPRYKTSALRIRIPASAPASLGLRIRSKPIVALLQPPNDRRSGGAVGDRNAEHQTADDGCRSPGAHR